MLSTASSTDSIVRSFPEPPGKIMLLHGGGEIFPFSLTMAAQAMRNGMPIAVVDGANRFDVHLLARFARERRMDADAFLHRIYISRGFTCYQMEQAIVSRLPAFLRRIGSTVGMVFGLLDTFYDEQAPIREVQQILTRVQTAFAAMKADGVSLLVVCRDQRVAPEERNRLFATLQRSVDVSYQLTSEEGRWNVLSPHGQVRNPNTRPEPGASSVQLPHASGRGGETRNKFKASSSKFLTP
jgi:hypothetical protein